MLFALGNLYMARGELRPQWAEGAKSARKGLERGSKVMKAAAIVEKFAKFGAAPIKNERYVKVKSKVELICVS
jgi:hypothetical protein